MRTSFFIYNRMQPDLEVAAYSKYADYYCSSYTRPRFTSQDDEIHPATYNARAKDRSDCSTQARLHWVWQVMHSDWFPRDVHQIWKKLGDLRKIYSPLGHLHLWYQWFNQLTCLNLIYVNESITKISQFRLNSRGTGKQNGAKQQYTRIALRTAQPFTVGWQYSECNRFHIFKMPKLICSTSGSSPEGNQVYTRVPLILQIVVYFRGSAVRRRDNGVCCARNIFDFLVLRLRTEGSWSCHLCWRKENPRE